VTSVAQARHGGERSEAAGQVGFIELFFDVALLGAALPALATWSLALLVLASVVLMDLRGP
jgi:hypothetical protein